MNLFGIAVDTHVSRVSSRLGFSKKNDDPYTTEKKLSKIFKKEKSNNVYERVSKS